MTEEGGGGQGGGVGKWFAQGRPQRNGTCPVLRVIVIGRKFGLWMGHITLRADRRETICREKRYVCVDPGTAPLSVGRRDGGGCCAVGQMVPCPMAGVFVLLGVSCYLLSRS